MIEVVVRPEWVYQIGTLPFAVLAVIGLGVLVYVKFKKKPLWMLITGAAVAVFATVIAITSVFGVLQMTRSFDNPLNVPQRYLNTDNSNVQEFSVNPESFNEIIEENFGDYETEFFEEDPRDTVRAFKSGSPVSFGMETDDGFLNGSVQITKKEVSVNIYTVDGNVESFTVPAKELK